MNKRGPTPRRLALAAEVKRLYESDAGLTLADIAKKLGIGRSYTSALYSDPDGAKARARKDSYSKPCPDCGKPMSGSEGKTVGPSYCADCTPKHMRIWTPETVIAAFQSFYRRFGRTPTTTDTVAHAPTVSARLSTERIAEIPDDHDLPDPATVRKFYGTWANGQAAAGVPVSKGGGEPLHRGLRRATKRRDEAILQAIRDGYETTQMIAAATGYERANLSRVLADFAKEGRVIRTPTRRWGRPNHYTLPD